jgi:hypothetical protein
MIFVILTHTTAMRLCFLTSELESHSYQPRDERFWPMSRVLEKQHRQYVH